MTYIQNYASPIGNILLTANETSLTGLWLNSEKKYAPEFSDKHISKSTAVLELTKRWLDIYFGGNEPKFTPPLAPDGSEFQHTVWKILLQIPYGKTVTYGEIAQEIASLRGICKMSARAVGGAVGHNRISIIIPCHRVIGANGNLTGYAGGIDKKIRLLDLEKAKIGNFPITEGNN